MNAYPSQKNGVEHFKQLATNTDHPFQLGTARAALTNDKFPEETLSASEIWHEPSTKTRNTRPKTTTISAACASHAWQFLTPEHSTSATTVLAGANLMRHLMVVSEMYENEWRTLQSSTMVSDVA